METVLNALEQTQAKLKAYWRTKNDLDFEKELEFKGVKAALEALWSEPNNSGHEEAEVKSEAPQHEEILTNAEHEL